MFSGISYYLQTVYWATVLFLSQDKQVKNAKHFLNESEGFLGTAKHFYYWSNLFGTEYVDFPIQHHFLVKTKCYTNGRTCTVDMIHYEVPNNSSELQVVLTSFKMKKGSFKDGNKDYYNRLNNGEWHMLTLLGEEDKTDEELDNIWRKAESMIGKTEYDLFFNNCETFINSMRYDIPISVQTVSKGGVGLAEFLRKKSSKLSNKFESMLNALSGAAPSYIMEKKAEKAKLVSEMNTLKRRTLKSMKQMTNRDIVKNFNKMIRVKQVMVETKLISS